LSLNKGYAMRSRAGESFVAPNSDETLCVDALAITKSQRLANFINRRSRVSRAANHSLAEMAEQVPAGWLTAHSNTYGQIYYFNTFTGKGQWNRPPLKRPREDGTAQVLPQQQRPKLEAAQQSAQLVLRVAIIVPFRDEHKEQNRSAHLAQFAPKMTEFMSRCGVVFQIFIVTQSNDGRKVSTTDSS
jgi:WW domain/N-terminal region of glycosyl transferase group 7